MDPKVCAYLSHKKNYFFFVEYNLLCFQRFEIFHSSSRSFLSHKSNFDTRDIRLEERKSKFCQKKVMEQEKGTRFQHGLTIPDLN